jgi:hypothetical protein
MRALFALVFFGCGSSPEIIDAAPEDTGVLDAGVAMDASKEADASDTGADIQDAADELIAPAPHMPVLDYLGGAILSSIQIVTITFTSDNAQVVQRMQLLGDTITQTPWWSAATSEYCILPQKTTCIGKGSNGGHVVLNEAPPASLVDTDDGNGSTVVQFIQSHIDNGSFPAPGPQILYAIYFPTGTSIKFGNSNSCSNFGAYHYSATLTPKGGGQAVETAYALMPRCAGEPYLATATSHEFIEAATDAHPGKDRGWVMQDPSFPLLGDENGDLCDHPWGGVFETTVESTFTVQRGWSNQQALAGHDPCAPANANEVWFAAGPVQQEIVLGLGQQTTIPVFGMADGMIADWALSAADNGPYFGSNTALGVSIDKATANNGTVAQLTLKLNALPTRGFAPYAIISKTGGREMHWGGYVRAK